MSLNEFMYIRYSESFLTDTQHSVSPSYYFYHYNNIVVSNDSIIIIIISIITIIKKCKFWSHTVWLKFWFHH